MSVEGELEGRQVSEAQGLALARGRESHSSQDPARVLNELLLTRACESLAYTGTRIGEALGLCRADIDLDSALVRVHRQLSRQREHRPLKTEAGRREVILAPAVAKLLREHWLASSYKTSDALVFANTVGRALDYRDVGKGFRSAVKRSGVSAPGRLSLHSLRHGFASLLIAKGLDVVFVLRQLGHANPTVTLGTYAHLSERADHAHSARAALQAGYRRA